MVCRTTYFNSALTSHVRLMANLDETQILSLSHELMREGRTAPNPTGEQVNDLIDARIAAVRADENLSPARQRSLISRLERARTQEMDGRLFYSASRLEERARNAAAALDGYCERAARELGVSRDDIRSRLAVGMETAEAGGRTARAPEEWTRTFGADAANRHLPLDRQTAYAIHAVERQRAERASFSPSRPAVIDRVPVRSSFLRTMGYDPHTQRLEMEIAAPNEPGGTRTYAYRVPPHVYAHMVELNNDPDASLGSYYSRDIRRRAEYQYESASAADAAATVRQCPSCGQFAGAGHSCPPAGDRTPPATTRPVPVGVGLGQMRAETGWSYEARVDAYTDEGDTVSDAQSRVDAEDLMLARGYSQDASGTWNAPELDDPAVAAASDPAVLAAAGLLSSDAPAPAEAQVRRMDSNGYSTRNYRSDRLNIRTLNLSAVQQEARSGDAVAVVVHATGAASDGTRGSVRGEITVESLGPRRGFRVGRVDEDDPTSSRTLRCSCAQYAQSYDCPHIREAMANISNRLNSSSIRNPELVRAARRVVADDLARDRDASLDSQAAARAGYVASPVSYTDDPAAFQEAYAAAKAREAAGEPAVAYMTENATGGLGARGTGRAFGVELEFDIGRGNRATALQAIGRDLAAAGLTRSAGQAHYHAAASRGYTDSHQGGWSFEADCTVAGEIVSPIMYDEPETWENIQKVCDIVKRHGGTATVRTGAHVHIGVGDFDHTVENHTRLAQIVRENNDTLTRLASNPSRGTHRDMGGGSGYSGVRGGNSAVPSAGYRTVSEASQSNRRGTPLNLGAVTGRPTDHAEFRAWDGTLEPSVIQTHIKLSLAMAAAAHRETGVPTSSTPEPIGTHKTQNRQHRASTGRTRLSGEAWQQDTESVRKLADRLFTRPEDKAQLASLFAVTKWQG